MEETRMRQGLTELNYIMNHMSDSLQAKIPDAVKENIRQQMDDTYLLDVDIAKDYTQQNFMPETKAFLSLLLSDYIGDEACQKKWKEFDDTYTDMVQQEVQKQWNGNLFETKEVPQKEKPAQLNSLVEVRETWIQKIVRKIRSFFWKGE